MGTVKSAATRKDVARLAGVSTATVSYYINGSGYVSKEKRQRIARAIEELDYQPNLIAKSLKVKDTKQIVFLCSEIKNPFHAHVAYQAATEAYNHDYTILFCNVIDDERYIARICSYQVSGVFIATNRLPPEAIRRITSRHIPAVLLDERMSPDIPEEVSRIILDYGEVMARTVDLMVERGKTRLFYLSSNPAEDLTINDGKTEAVVRAAEANPGCAGLTVVRGMTSALDTYRLVTERYREEIAPGTAFLCTNDDTALGVMRAMEDLGRSVPRDVAVVGVGNTYLSEMSVPRLSTIDVEIDLLSRRAIQMLVDRSGGREVPNLWIKAKLIERETT